MSSRLDFLLPPGVRFRRAMGVPRRPLFSPALKRVVGSALHTLGHAMEDGGFAAFFAPGVYATVTCDRATRAPERCDREDDRRGLLGWCDLVQLRVVLWYIRRHEAPTKCHHTVRALQEWEFAKYAILRLRLTTLRTRLRANVLRGGIFLALLMLAVTMLVLLA